MNITQHFTLEEFTTSDTATRLQIDNVPGVDVLKNLVHTGEGLEKVRAFLGYPLKITSGYRSLELNRHVGSKDNSQHVKGEAADFLCPQFGSPKQIVSALVKSDLVFDQLIQEFAPQGWVHISFSDTPRQLVLIIDHEGVRNWTA